LGKSRINAIIDYGKGEKRKEKREKEKKGRNITRFAAIEQSSNRAGSSRRDFREIAAEIPATRRMGRVMHRERINRAGCIKESQSMYRCVHASVYRAEFDYREEGRSRPRGKLAIAQREKSATEETRRQAKQEEDTNVERIARSRS